VAVDLRLKKCPTAECLEAVLQAPLTPRVQPGGDSQEELAAARYIQHHTKRYPIIVAVSMMIHQLVDREEFNTGNQEPNQVRESDLRTVDSESSNEIPNAEDEHSEPGAVVKAATPNQVHCHSSYSRNQQIFCQLFCDTSTSDDVDAPSVCLKDVTNFLITCYKLARWPSEVHVHTLALLMRLMINTPVRLTRNNWRRLTLTALLICQKLNDGTQYMGFCSISSDPDRVVFSDRPLRNSEFPKIWNMVCTNSNLRPLTLQQV
jgi:hypothetical protein